MLLMFKKDFSIFIGMKYFSSQSSYTPTILVISFTNLCSIIMCHVVGEGNINMNKSVYFSKTAKFSMPEI